MKVLLKRIILGVLTICVLLLIIKSIYTEPRKSRESLLSINNLKTQLFIIDSNSDTVIFGNRGTLLKIDKNSFSYSNGSIVDGEIKIELIEVLSMTDLILSGLTTTSNRQILETDGMLYINASKDNRTIHFNNSSKIGVVIPSDEINMEMQLFTGEPKNNIIDWQNPVALLNNPDSVSIGEIPEEFLDFYGFERARFVADSLGIIVRGIPKPLIATKAFYDSLYAQIDARNNAARELQTTIGYVFETNKIGWLNIDRFIKEFDSDSINFSIAIDNSDYYTNLSVVLVLKRFNSVINANLIENNLFVFGKSKNSIVQLPIGEEAIIIATGFRKGKPYYVLGEITIQAQQELKFELTNTSIKELEKLINDMV